MPDGNEFLELRARGQPAGAALDTEPAGASMDSLVPGWSAAARASGNALVAVSRSLLLAAAEDAGLSAHALGELADLGDALGAGELSATQHRFCYYCSKDYDVSFEAHTDATFATLVPAARIPGLEVRSPRGRGRPAARPRSPARRAAAPVLVCLTSACRKVTPRAPAGMRARRGLGLPGAPGPRGAARSRARSCARGPARGRHGGRAPAGCEPDRRPRRDAAPRARAGPRPRPRGWCGGAAQELAARPGEERLCPSMRSLRQSVLNR